MLANLANTRSAQLTKTCYSMTLPASVPNHTSHFTIGDIDAWSGIKRAGNAMSMAQIASVNIWSAMLCHEHSEKNHLRRSCFGSLDEPIRDSTILPSTPVENDAPLEALAELSMNRDTGGDKQELTSLRSPVQFPSTLR